MLKVATVLKPQGIKGELKVINYLDSSEYFQKIHEVIIDNLTYKVSQRRVTNDFVFITLLGVEDMNAAEKFRGKDVFISDANKPKLPAGRYYVEDVIGCKLVTLDGKEIGILKDILQYGSADVYVATANPQFMFPSIPSVVLSYDILAKIIVVDEIELEKVRVYEV